MKQKKVGMDYVYLPGTYGIPNWLADQPFTVDTLGGVVTCEVAVNKSIISVEMGKVSFHSDVFLSLWAIPRGKY